MASKYRKIKLKDGTTIDEHRFIMETILGRKLNSDEVVHHKDRNSLNNSIDNLEVMSRKDHTSMHAKEYDCSHCKFPVRIGEDVVNSKLTEALVIELRELFSTSRKGIRAKAKELGVSHSAIIRALNRDTWSHVR